MLITSSHYTQIATLLSGKLEDTALSISKANDGKYTFLIGKNKACQSSFDHFRELVGKKRFHRLCKHRNTTPLTKKLVTKVFFGMLQIQKSDLDAMEGPVQERFKRLALFKDFNAFEASLLHPSPKIEQLHIDRAASSGKGLEGLAERVSVLMHHHFRVLEETNKTAASLRDAEMLTSRLADREMEEGLVVHLHEGYFYVDRVFAREGAYISVLRDLEGNLPPKIVCRGTATRLTATEGLKSGVNDLLLEIGTTGVKAIWPKLSKYLKEEEIASVEILGKSLGGAHAQQLAVLTEGVAGIKINKLTTYCSTGVSGYINALFRKNILRNRSTPFQIHIIRNGGDGAKVKADFVPVIGGTHLGTKTKSPQCKTTITYIRPGKGSVECLPKNLRFSDLARRFFHSFQAPHLRQTTLGEFSWKTIEAKDHHHHLRMDKRIEKIRRVIAFIIHLLTLSFLNGRSFTTFYKASETVAKKSVIRYSPKENN